MPAPRDDDQHGEESEEFQAMDALISRVYDVRQKLVLTEHQSDGADVASALGSHWAGHKFSALVTAGYALPGSPAALTREGEKLLVQAAGIPPLPPPDLAAVTEQAMAGIVAHVDPVAFRVMPLMGGKIDGSVACICSRSFNPTEAELVALTNCGLKLLAAGGFGLGFAPPRPSMFNAGEHTVFVGLRPGKPPRTDISLERALAALKGITPL